jgi:hypothetical protein
VSTNPEDFNYFQEFHYSLPIYWMTAKQVRRSAKRILGLKKKETLTFVGIKTHIDRKGNVLFWKEDVQAQIARLRRDKDEQAIPTLIRKGPAPGTTISWGFETPITRGLGELDQNQVQHLADFPETPEEEKKRHEIAAQAKFAAQMAEYNALDDEGKRVYRETLDKERKARSAEFVRRGHQGRKAIWGDLAVRDDKPVECRHDQPDADSTTTGQADIELTPLDNEG